jgi:quercetin dioxygenase-like cupin family protein
MKRAAIAAAIFVAAVVSSRWSVAGAGQLDPLKVAPDTHKLLFENPYVRVLEVRVPPGKTEPWHEHPRRVVIYLSDFHTRVTEKGGKPTETLRTRGFVRWTEPTVHQVENIGKTEGHVINVELK